MVCSEAAEHGTGKRNRGFCKYAEKFGLNLWSSTTREPKEFLSAVDA